MNKEDQLRKVAAAKLCTITYTGWQGTGAHALLLATTTDLSVKSDSGLSANVESTDALGSVQLVATNGKQVNVHLIDINWDFADALRSIRVEEHLVLAADRTDLLDGLNDTDLVVHVNHGADKCVRSDRSLQHIQVDETIRSDRQVSDFEAFVLELPA